MIENAQQLASELEKAFASDDLESVSLLYNRVAKYTETQYDLLYRPQDEEAVEDLRAEAEAELERLRALGADMSILEKLGFTSLVEVDGIMEAKWNGYLRDAEYIYLVVNGEYTVGFLNCRVCRIFLEENVWDAYEGPESWFNCMGIDFHKTLTEAGLRVDLTDTRLEQWDITHSTK